MIVNYLKIVIRLLGRDKGYSLINILGLSFGLACALFILLWVHEEKTVDHQFTDRDRIYRVIAEVPRNHDTVKVAVTPSALANDLEKQVPEIINAGRFQIAGSSIFSFDGKTAKVDSGAFADQQFLDIFQFKVVEGNLQDALTNDSSIVITRTLAKRVFDDDNSLGMPIEIKNLGLFEVKAVIEDVNHTHFPFTFLISFSVLNEKGFELDDYLVYNYSTYILADRNDVEFLNKRIRSFISDQNVESNAELTLQPLDEIYLQSDFLYDFSRTGSLQTIKYMLLLAIFIMVLVCANFINLSSANISKRIREIGIRKVVGAGKNDLVKQFYLESFALVVISLLIGVVLVEILLPFYNDIIGYELTVRYISFGGFYILVFGVLLISGFLIGSYPAIYLSSYKPSDVLRAGNVQRIRGGLLRKVFIILQFTLTLSLLASTIFISRQYNLLISKDLGYDATKLIYIESSPELRKNVEELNGLLEKCPSIESITEVSFLPVYEGPSASVNSIDEDSVPVNSRIHFFDGTENVVKTLGLQLIDGNDFVNFADIDTINRIILNEKAVNEWEIVNPVGKRIEISGQAYQITGIVADFHYNTLRDTIQPMGIRYNPEFVNYFFIRYRDKDKVIGYLKKIWPKIDDEFPLEMNFFDETITQLYHSEKRMFNISIYFSILFILISSLSLYGFVIFLGEKYKKEIALKKVLGVSPKQLFYSLTWKYMKWILLANVLSWLITWVFSYYWTDNYAYAVPFNISIFIISGLYSLIIAFITAGYKVVTIVKEKPLETLKYE